MFDLRDWPEEIWDDSLKPKGYGGHYYELEKYDEWKERTAALLAHLHPEICEQWIYRHWTYSPLNFIPLDSLSWTEESWEPEYFIEHVQTYRGNTPLNPEDDYKTFAEPETGEKLDTAIALDAGHWDYAPVVLRTPDGFIDTIGEVVKAKYLLVEGHQRRQYLNALLYRGTKLPSQRVFVLDSPIVKVPRILRGEQK